jgi:hypothetical protein
VENSIGKPLSLTLLGVINPYHLHDPNGMSQPDDTTKTLSKHGLHFATGLKTEKDALRAKSSIESEPGYRLLLPYSDYRNQEV